MRWCAGLLYVWPQKAMQTRGVSTTKSAIPLKKVISGGQTGVDRAALDAALAAGLEIGGWCPPGRSAHDGVIPDQYPLHETPVDRSPDAPDTPRSMRTDWNVRDSDATLILAPAIHKPDPGILWTIHCAMKYKKKPFLIADAMDPDADLVIRNRIMRHHIRILNIAGPPSVDDGDIYTITLNFLQHLFRW
jgi:hypothetical protein